MAQSHRKDKPGGGDDIYDFARYARRRRSEESAGGRSEAYRIPGKQAWHQDPGFRLILMKNRNILICPLEWGLGHAARMIPLASKLRDMHNNIFIGSGEEHLSLFRSELPGLSYIKFGGFKPGYSRFFPQYLALLLKMPL